MKWRIYKLQSWLIRALIPTKLTGTYVLYDAGDPIYVGRSDRDLQQRLLQHAASGRGEYFSYDALWHPLAAFEVECSLFHALGSEVGNVLHPARPDYVSARCPFCPESFTEVRDSRLGITPAVTQVHINAGTETSRPSHA